jgi:hypothetical protein
MHAQIVSKISAFAVAIMMHSLMILGLGYVFSEGAHACVQATVAVDSVEQLPPLVGV